MHSSRLTVLTVAALMLALSFGGGATAAVLITGADIKDNTVTTADIKDGSLKVGDLSKPALTQLTGSGGVTYYDDQNGYTVSGGGDKSFTIECVDGMTAIAAVGGFLTPSAAAPSTISKMNETTYAISGHNGDSGDNYLWMYVTCVRTAPFDS